MAKTKISEFSATPGNNTDIDSINIAENCAPSGINDAIRELMAQLKDFQTGAVGDSFNGPVGTTTAAAGAFTTLAASGAVTLSGGTANGVPYLNGSKVLTSGSALVFDGSNLGLGVTPSAWTLLTALQVKNASIYGYANEGGFYSNAYYASGSWRYTATATATGYDSNALAGGHRWYTAPSGTAGAAISFVQAMTLDVNGRLIVGASAQSGTVARAYIKQASDLGFTGAVVVSADAKEWAGTLSVLSDGVLNISQSYLGAGGSYQPISFSTSGAERARIDVSGNLNISNTVPLSSARLSVWNATNGAGGLGVGYGSTAGQFRIMYALTNGVFYFDNGTNTPSLSAAGAWTNASDGRLKNSITDIKYGLADVLNTQPRSYKMNDLEGDYIGFIAQELQTVIPEVVSGDPEKQLGVDYGSLVAVAFKAIQEQQALILTLQADVAALKAAA